MSNPERSAYPCLAKTRFKVLGEGNPIRFHQTIHHAIAEALPYRGPSFAGFPNGTYALYFWAEHFDDELQERLNSWEVFYEAIGKIGLEDNVELLTGSVNCRKTFGDTLDEFMPDNVIQLPTRPL